MGQVGVLRAETRGNLDDTQDRGSLLHVGDELAPDRVVGRTAPADAASETGEQQGSIDRRRRERLAPEADDVRFDALGRPPHPDS